MARKGSTDHRIAMERIAAVPDLTSLAMTRTSAVFKAVADRNPVRPNEHDRPVNQDPNNPATVDEFKLERMGIAAKE